MKTLLGKLNYKGQKRIVVMNAIEDLVLASGDEFKDVQVDNEIDPRYPYEFMMIFVRKSAGTIYSINIMTRLMTIYMC